jgi:hypothetical protein
MYFVEDACFENKLKLTHINRGKGKPLPKSFLFSPGCSKIKKLH